ncbi:MAG: SDR family oxidoreductase [Bauldia sp.]|uniref:SDR family NAD(P)-dependent oxidoreductase n=1 Tax=Bauldia sp. TaxID=2575872 RepID=UPI001DB80B83|nr:SDR family oxidoreductase [Bauldia sp.]MCB1497032.1 SDR family oxidoreductase [Bauldia sp.]
MPDHPATTRPLALVTGASSGIGRVFAERLAGDGHDVILVARRRQRLEALAGQIETGGRRAEVIVADLTTAEGLAAVEARASKGDVTMLVNNAGFQTYMPFVELDADRAEGQVRAQVTTVVRLCRAALPAMIARDAGAIVNVSSTLAFSAGMRAPHLPKRATYAATKAFVNAFTEILAGELEGTGVRVQALCPGVVRTEFHNVGDEPLLRPKIPVMEPEDVVAASLAALALGDVVCQPALVDRALIEREGEARHAVFAAGVSADLSPRYRVAKTD